MPIALPATAQEYLAERRTLLARRLAEVNAKAEADALEDVRIRGDGMRISPLKAVTPAAAEEAAERLYGVVPPVRVTELMLESEETLSLVPEHQMCDTSRDNMPKRRAPCPAPIQLPLFAEAASLVRIRPEHNEWRFYRLEVWPALFGRALLLRHWGRIGTEGHRRLDSYPDPGAALNALAALLRTKRRRGYQDRGA